MSVSKLAGILLGSAALVAGHGYVSGAVVDGTYYGGYLVNQYPYESDPPETIGWSEDETDLGYIDGSEYSNANIICHKDGKPGALSAPVKAGGSVELQWTTWPSSHHGPVLTYLAKCNGNCSSVDKTTLEFFKIDEGGLISDNDEPGTWATDQLISNNNSRTVTIPSSIEAGNYVLRHEIIALHSAEETNGAQNYPQCLNLEVTGGGSDSPTGTLGTSLYKDTDPGILINIYQSLSTYDIPGPALYTGAASDSTATSPVATSATATATTTSAATSQGSASIEALSSTTASPVSASPVRTPSALPHSFNSTRGTRPPFGRRPSSSSSAPTPKFSQPGGPMQPPNVASTVTDTATSQVTEQVTVTDKPAVQTPSIDPDVVTVTSIVTGQSIPSATSRAATSGSDISSGSDSSSGSTSSSATTASSTPGPDSSYNSKDWSSYLSSLSAEQFLDMLRQTMRWLVADKKHARDLGSN
ncbi:uncharacterized protein N7459_007076 [Penicillium hispanicum]|uniref:uncharacterized protein n=1 Tax=Penicillium hispanicum TaxID=1080232 RepID=UPI00253FED98|nr:uncharacterized protein N7459_007076 [Penicillium hispanicum]KAJ5578112.1 hypothetical protein N7459_007076 [Penicillium hispanicum]